MWPSDCLRIMGNSTRLQNQQDLYDIAVATTGNKHPVLNSIIGFEKTSTTLIQKQLRCKGTLLLCCFHLTLGLSICLGNTNLWIFSHSLILLACTDCVFFPHCWQVVSKVDLNWKLPTSSVAPIWGHYYPLTLFLLVLSLNQSKYQMYACLCVRCSNCESVFIPGGWGEQ